MSGKVTWTLERIERLNQAIVRVSAELAAARADKNERDIESLETALKVLVALKVRHLAD